jgi:predicted alpha/beta-fold hydrolase
MPVIPSRYAAPTLLKSPHLHSVYANIFRYAPQIAYSRDIFPTRDGEAVVLDKVLNKSSNLVILCHGIAGDSQSLYIRGMVQAFSLANWNVVVLNSRGRFHDKSRNFYHLGYTQDLAQVVDHFIKPGIYERVVLVGFSMGANTILKYLGELGPAAPAQMTHAVVFSAPIDCVGSGKLLEQPANRWVSLKILREVQVDLARKRSFLESFIDLKGALAAETWLEFDNAYTAPMHGYRNAIHYRQAASSKPLLGDIRIKTLIVNSKDDPVLSEECFPEEAAAKNPHLFCEFPLTGGHMAFLNLTTELFEWPEKRSLEFINNQP